MKFFRFIFPSLLSVLWLWSALSAAAEVETRQPEELISALGAADFEGRRNAVQALAKLGEKARTALEQAQRESSDPEVRIAAEGLLRDLNRPSLHIYLYDVRGMPLRNQEITLLLWALDAGVAPSLAAARTTRETAVNLVTDKNGIAQTPVSHPGLYAVNLSRLADDRTPQFLGYSRLRLGQRTTPLLFTRVSSSAVSGRILCAAGKPFEGLTVRLLPVRSVSPQFFPQEVPGRAEAALQLTSATDEEGTWKINNAPAGVYRLTVQRGQLLRAGQSFYFKPELGPLVRVGEKRTTAADDFQSSFQRLPAAADPEEPGIITLKLPDKVNETINKKRGFYYDLTPLDDNVRGLGQAANFPPALVLAVEDDHSAKIENVIPGRYRLTIRPTQRAPLVIEPVLVNAKETTALGEKRFPKGCVLEGTLKTMSGDANNAHFTFHAFEESDVEPATPIVQWLMQARYQHRLGVNRSAAAQRGGGKFRLENLSVGRKVLAVYGPNGPVGVVFGLALAEDGKTLTCPRLDLYAPSGVKQKAIKGKVLADDNKPVGGATITCWRNVFLGSAVSIADNAHPSMAARVGEFNLSVPESVADERGFWLCVSSPDHQPLIRRITAKELPETLTLQLSARTYGEAKIFATDDQGAPLPGVRIEPLLSWKPALTPSVPTGAGLFMHGGGRGLPHRLAPAKTTGKDGVVLFQGLSGGRRFFNLADDGPQGWWLAEPLCLTVRENETTELVLRAKRGLRLTGRVAMPTHKNTAPIFVRLFSSVESLSAYGQHLVIADEDGTFCFSGLPAGAWSVAAESPGFATVSTPILLREDGRTEPEEVLVQLRPTTALTFQLQNEEPRRPAPRTVTRVYSWAVDLTPSGLSRLSFSPTTADARRFVAATGSLSPATPFVEIFSEPADERGFVEFAGLPLGEYDVWLRQVSVSSQAVYGYGGLATEEKTFYRLNRAFRVPTQSAEIMKLKLPSAAESGELCLRVAVKNLPPLPSREVRLLFASVSGEKAETDWRSLPLTSVPGAPEYAPFFVVGEPPAGVTAPENGILRFPQLPPGTYRVFVWANVFETAPVNLARLVADEPASPEESSLKILTVNIEAGKTTDAKIEWTPTAKESSDFAARVAVQTPPDDWSTPFDRTP
jgi:hypothetical protein